MKRIVILTGAGVSAESGIPTFRDANGLWEKHRVEDVASPEGFRRNPDLVRRFYNERRRGLLSPSVQPNAAHRAIAALQNAYPRHVSLITQNVDDLHERGGSPCVIHMHGELLKARCVDCDRVRDWRRDITEGDFCPHCGGSIRPHIVWFGETPLFMDIIGELLKQVEVFAAIGTSGAVYPAAGFVEVAKSLGAETVEINLEPSANSAAFDLGLYGLASEEVPKWVDRILS